MDINDVKACLRALLCSTKNNCTVEQLLEDFKQFTGQDLPFFEHENVIEFLQTISDTVKLYGKTLNSKIQAVKSQKSAHIVSLVSKQKNKFRSVLPTKPSNVNPNRYYKENVTPIIKPLQQCLPSEISTHPSQLVNSFFEATKNVQVANEKTENMKSLTNDMEKKLSSYSEDFTNINICCLIPSSEVQSKVDDDLDCFEEYTNTEDMHKLICTSENVSLLPFTFINDSVKQKLKQLIRQFPNGIWCCDLPNLFAHEYDYELDYKEFGYTSLIQMVSELPDIFRCIRPGVCDWILFDASAPTSLFEKKIVDSLEQGDLESIELLVKSNFGVATLDEISNLKIDLCKEGFADMIPKEVMGPNDRLPSLVFDSFIASGSRFEIYGAEVWSPSKFFVCLNKFKCHFNKFMEDLQEFYNIHVKKYKMPDSIIRPKQVCVGLYASDPAHPEEWQRAEIIKILNDKTVTVQFVDFGTLAIIKKSRLRFLHKAFQRFPIQGFAAKLAGISPIDNSSKWPIETCKRLLKLLMSPYLEAEIVDIECKDNPCFNLIVYNPNNKCCPSLNRQLIDENLAKIEGSILLNRDKTFIDSTLVEKKTSNLFELQEEDLSLICCKKMEQPKLNKRSDCNTENLKSENSNGINKESERSYEIKNKISNTHHLFDIEEDNLDLLAKSSLSNFNSNINNTIETNQFFGEHVASTTVSDSKTLCFETPQISSECRKFNKKGCDSPLTGAPILENQKSKKNKKINILALELLTTNSDIREVAILNLELALRIAVQMAELIVKSLFPNYSQSVDAETKPNSMNNDGLRTSFSQSNLEKIDSVTLSGINPLSEKNSHSRSEFQSNNNCQVADVKIRSTSCSTNTRNSSSDFYPEVVSEIKKDEIDLFDSSCNYESAVNFSYPKNEKPISVFEQLTSDHSNALERNN